MKYYAIEPELSEPERDLFDTVRHRILERSVKKPAPDVEAAYDDRIEELLEETVVVADASSGERGGFQSRLKNVLGSRLPGVFGGESRGQLSMGSDRAGSGPGLVDRARGLAAGPARTLERFQGRIPEWERTLERTLGYGRIPVDGTTYDTMRYQLNRDIVGLGPLEPAMRDRHNEDIHVIGPEQTYVDHGTFGLLSTTIQWESEERFDNWLRNIGERMGDPVSDTDPIIDSTLPGGSRINIIYSDDVSIKGPSVTIRQGDDVPLSVGQITKWGTLSPQLAAYLWLCLENEQTVFVVGETASGKTTTLNAIMTFIPRDSKIYTAEDTAEVLPPHDTWQQLLTREGQGEASADVSMFDLVAAALRSRPDYIVVGEVRGEEGRMAFQAAQTGHPVLLTFHASDIVSMIQRFTGDPINVPETFMDNADVALFQ
ncbi:MAG: type II/IV secretion system ATPase subunit, partial [Halodesulfurarchaeum sp.]